MPTYIFKHKKENRVKMITAKTFKMAKIKLDIRLSYKDTVHSGTPKDYYYSFKM